MFYPKTGHILAIVDDIFENDVNTTDAKFYTIKLVNTQSSVSDVYVKGGYEDVILRKVEMFCCSIYVYLGQLF